LELGVQLADEVRFIDPVIGTGTETENEARIFERRVAARSGVVNWREAVAKVPLR
jgi:hypothetical protein